jgi:hypothetical protein
MDPITLVVTALALGAAAGLKPTAEQAIKDAYAGLKKLIQDRYAKARPAVELLESDPAQETYKLAAGQALAKVNTSHDIEVLQQAQALLKLVKEYAPETAGDIHITAHEIDVMTDINIEQLIARGNVDIDLGKVTSHEGGFRISGVQSGSDTPKA